MQLVIFQFSIKFVVVVKKAKVLRQLFSENGSRNFRNQNWLKVKCVFCSSPFSLPVVRRKWFRKFLTPALTIKVSPRLKPDGQMSLSNYGIEKSGFANF